MWFDASTSQDGTANHVASDCSDSDTPDPITSYTWTFGDGTSVTTNSPTVWHTFAAASGATPYQVTLVTHTAHRQSPAYSKNVAVAKNPTTTTLSAPSSATYGDVVTVGATVNPSSGSPAPTGTVVFYINGISSADSNQSLSNGSATYTLPNSLTPGTYSLFAGYQGDDASDNSSSSTQSFTLNKATPTISLSSSANPSTQGGPVTFTATVGSNVTPAPSGTVTLYSDGTLIGSGSLSGGTASYTTSALASGSHQITAVYGGDSYYTSVTSSALPQTVKAAAGGGNTGGGSGGTAGGSGGTAGGGGGTTTGGGGSSTANGSKHSTHHRRKHTKKTKKKKHH